MATSWFLCPYDSFKLGPRLMRRPAMHRHYPVIPNEDGVVWEEAETLGNHCVVKVIGPDTALAKIRADTGFFEFNPSTTIPANRRNQVRNRLTQLGFTSAEVDGTGFVITQILALLTSAAALVGPSADGTTVEAKPGRKVAPKTVDQIEARLPG